MIGLRDDIHDNDRLGGATTPLPLNTHSIIIGALIIIIIVALTICSSIAPFVLGNLTVSRNPVDASHCVCIFKTRASDLLFEVRIVFFCINSSIILI